MKNLVTRPHIILSVQNSPYPDKVTNPLSHEEAIAKLKSAGAGQVLSLQGHYNKPEESILISNPSDAQAKMARELAHSTGQESHIESDGHSHKMYFNHGPEAGKIVYGKGTVWHENKPNDYYSTLPSGEHFTHNFDFEKTESLEKGVMQRLAPVPRTPEKPAKVDEWLMGGGERDDVPRQRDPNRRARMLHRLSSQTEVRLTNDGKREFLLHRGEDPEAENVQLPSRSAPFLSHSTSSSWTPFRKVAHAHAVDNATNNERPHVVHSAWIHEDNIKNIPFHYGKLDEQKKGPQSYKHEHEVIVEPNHESELHDSYEAHPYPVSSYEDVPEEKFGPSIHEKINTRAKKLDQNVSLAASELEKNLKKAPIAYHGSTRAFEEHEKPKKSTKATLNYGPGIYYTTDPQEASEYAEPQIARVSAHVKAYHDIMKEPGYKAYRDEIAQKFGLANSIDTKHKNWKKFRDHMLQYEMQKVSEKLGLTPNVRRSDVQVKNAFDPHNKDHAIAVFKALGHKPNPFRLENEHKAGTNLYHHIAYEVPRFNHMKWGERTWHLNRAIKQAGFDGIHDKKIGHIIAFSPKQIKPAYGAEQKPKKMAASELEKGKIGPKCKQKLKAYSKRKGWQYPSAVVHLQAGRICGSKTKSEEAPADLKKDLRRWVKEKWANPKGETHHGSGKKGWRPTVKVSEKTPDTWGEMSSHEKKKKVENKKKANKRGGGWSTHESGRKQVWNTKKNENESSTDLKKEQWERKRHGMTLNPIHGVVSPTGEYYSMNAMENHVDKMIQASLPPYTKVSLRPEEKEQKIKELNKEGWVSLGTAGDCSIIGHSSVLTNPSHPATRTIRNLIAQAQSDPENTAGFWHSHIEIAHSDKEPVKNSDFLEHAPHVGYIDATHYSKYGKYKPHNNLRNSELKKGKGGDWEKEKYTFKHSQSTNPMIGSSVTKITALDSSGNTVGKYHFTDDTDPESIYAVLAETHPDHQRKGLATAAYKLAEKITQKKLEPSFSQSSEAQKLWAQKKRPFGKSELVKALPGAPQVNLNPEHGKIIAAAYDQMKHDPSHPEVKAAYGALIDETKKQFKDMLDQGLKISKVTNPKHNPYPTSKHLHADVDNGHIWLFPTELGFGSEDDMPKDHPMLQPTEFMHEGKPLLANDIFRVVHDSIHHKLRNGFGPKGEHESYLEHKKMYSPLAQKALATETMGQNSYVNFSSQIGHLNQQKPGSAYAPQKAGLLSENVINGKWHE